MNTNCLCALWCQTRSGDFVADKTCQPSMFRLKDTMGRAISGSYSIIWLVKSAIASRVKTEILLLPLWVWTCGNHPLKINVPPEKRHVYAATAATSATALQKWPLRQVMVSWRMAVGTSGWFRRNPRASRLWASCPALNSVTVRHCQITPRSVHSIHPMNL